MRIAASANDAVTPGDGSRARLRACTRARSIGVQAQCALTQTECSLLRQTGGEVFGAIRMTSTERMDATGAICSTFATVVAVTWMCGACDVRVLVRSRRAIEQSW
jgi:hypothetical protein